MVQLCHAHGSNSMLAYGELIVDLVCLVKLCTKYLWLIGAVVFIDAKLVRVRLRCLGVTRAPALRYNLFAMYPYEKTPMF
jgi:hypothetical protein